LDRRLSVSAQKNVGDLFRSPTASRGARGPSGCPFVGFGLRFAPNRYSWRPWTIATDTVAYATTRFQGCQPSGSRARLP
jgi:hypothetical protein